MSFTFGGATGDDLRFTMSVSAGATGQHTFCSGWFFPTTLTAGRGLWSFGTIVGSKIHTTTSELAMMADGSTTDSLHVTSGAGITTGKWWHISWLNSCNNTGPAAAWRVWIGDTETAPIEVTVTQSTAPVGTFTGNAGLVIGNLGTAGVVAFQGDVGNFTAYIQGATAINYSLPIATAGTITQEAADQVRDRLVRPLWQGTPDMRFFALPTASSSSELLHAPLDFQVTGSSNVFRRMIGSTAPIPSGSVLTVGGGTVSTVAPPTRPHDNWVNGVSPLVAVL